MSNSGYTLLKITLKVVLLSQFLLWSTTQRLRHRMGERPMPDIFIWLSNLIGKVPTK